MPMRRRAFRPEAPAALDDRSLMSGVVGPSAGPVVLPIRQLRLVVDRVQLTFSAFTRNSTFSQLREDLLSDVAAVPFGRADGLEASVDRIVVGLHDDLQDRAPFAVRSAERRMIATIRQDVAIRVRAGDLILR